MYENTICLLVRTVSKIIWGNKTMNACFSSFNRKIYLTNEIFYNRLTATQIRGELEMSLDTISVRFVVPSYIEIHKLGIITLNTIL